MSIFISIVSYRDTELLPTIKNIIDKAENKNNLFFGIVSQDEVKNHPDLSFIKNLSYIKMDFKEARGVGYARKLAMQMYNGQNFYLQLDSHMRASDQWDKKLIDTYNICADIEQNKKIILSQFPAPYEIHTNGSIFYPKKNKELWNKPSWSKVHNRDDGSWSSIRQEILDLSKPHTSHTILAGCLFSPSDFIKEVPYDERISFMGEELCIAIRAYTRGWKIYSPNQVLFWHFYKRKERPKIWNQIEDKNRPLKWIEMEMNSRKIQKNILLGKEKGIFGIGDYQKYLEFQEMIEINFAEFYEKTIHEKINNSVISQEIIF